MSSLELPIHSRRNYVGMTIFELVGSPCSRRSVQTPNVSTHAEVLGRLARAETDTQVLGTNTKSPRFAKPTPRTHCRDAFTTHKIVPVAASRGARSPPSPIFASNGTSRRTQETSAAPWSSWSAVSSEGRRGGNRNAARRRWKVSHQSRQNMYNAHASNATAESATLLFWAASVSSSTRGCFETSGHVRPLAAAPCQ